MTVTQRGFLDPVRDSQACFRAVMDAMARPGTVHALPVSLDPPAPLAPATAAALLTLADLETPVFLDTAAQAAAEWVRFHCGAPLAEVGQVDFAVCLEALPPLEAFLWGTHEEPEGGATVLLQVPSLEAGPVLRLTGPGVDGEAQVRLGLPADFAARWAAVRGSYPRGIDLVVCAGDRLAALPRSVRVG